MKKTIAFITSGLRFNGSTIYEKALGGSESALIYMAREMAAIGNDVTVYCRCDLPGRYAGVDYRQLDNFMSDEKSQFDILISSRLTEVFTMPLDTKLNILWCHDIDTHNFKDAMGSVDRVFCLSSYHKSLYANRYNIDQTDYIWKTSNGFDQSINVLPKLYSEKKNNFIYASRPERGLKLLLEKIWPKIIERNPSAILHICGYDHDLELPEEVQKIHDEITELLTISINVKTISYLPKLEYYELLSNCAYMLYPTDFPEISCINAIEAQYNECLVVTSDNYALQETVKSSTKVKAEYGSQQYIDDFLAVIDEFKDAVYQHTVSIAKQDILSYSWNNIAKRWDTEINFMITSRFATYKDKIIDQLVYNSDIVAAWQLTGDEKYRKMLDKARHDNLTIVDFTPQLKDEDVYLDGRGETLIKLVQNQLVRFPSKQLTILDLGSNDGILSLPLMKRFSKNIESLTMYDSCSSVLEFVESCYKTKYPQINYIVDDVANIMQYGLTPDIVIIGELLEHIEHTSVFLDFLMKLANKNTLFYFTVPCGPWENMVSHDEINHVHHFELTDIKTIFKNVDLTISKNNRTTPGRRGELCSNWLFWFTASKNDSIIFEQVDYQEKWIKSRSYKSISCCMIVKDEEDNLSRCLKSVSAFADEIIIVDTGSSDDTKQIASKFTNSIFDLEWLEADGLGNFARARNYSIAQATGDYIFWIDADEELEFGEQLFKFITSDYYDGVLLKQQQCMTVMAHKQNMNVDVTHTRLFRNRQIKFTGVIHEYPSKDGELHLAKVAVQEAAFILHYGLANFTAGKVKAITRNSALIYKNVRTYPNRVFAKHYILVDFWSRFICGHPNPDLSIMQHGLAFWHSDLKNCSNDWGIRLSIGIVQQFYSYCAINNIEHNSGIPKQVRFKNADDVVIDFFVIDPANETKFFLKYLSEFPIHHW